MAWAKRALHSPSAQQLRAHFADGVWFVSLAELDGDGNVAALETAIALQISAALDLTISARNAPLHLLLRQLRDQHLLLILDNFEHLIEAAGVVNQLLHACPHLTILATSRERLNLRDELTVALQGLALPGEHAADMRQSASVQLFADVAQQHDDHFVLDDATLLAVVDICRQLDGLPLGIELAASLIMHYEVEEVADLLAGQQFDSFTSARRDIPSRQRSLRAVFDYSWRLLPPTNQRVLAALSALRGVFDRKAAEAVAAASVADLRQLCDKSLVQQVGRGLYEMHPLVQQFSAETLAMTGFHHTILVQERHIAWFLGQLASYESDLLSERLLSARQALDPLLPNLRQAWRWAIQLQDVDWLKRSRLALTRYMRVRSAAHELLAYLQEAVVLFELLPDELSAAALFNADLACTLVLTNEHDKAQTVAARVLALSGAENEAVAMALWALGEIATRRGDLADGRGRLLQALALNGVSSQTTVQLAISLGNNWGTGGDDISAEKQFRHALAVAEQAGDQFNGMEALRLVGVSQINRVENADAVGFLERSLVLHRKLGVAYGEGRTLHGLGTLA